jgi:hypothetical protein
MSDDHDHNIVHGYKIESNGHEGLEEAVGKLTEEQLHDMKRIAAETGRAHVTLRVNGVYKDFKVHTSESSSGDKLSFHSF